MKKANSKAMLRAEMRASARADAIREQQQLTADATYLVSLGFFLYEIAERCGCCAATIYRIKEGIAKHTRSQTAELLRKEAAKQRRKHAAKTVQLTGY